MFFLPRYLILDNLQNLIKDPIQQIQQVILTGKLKRLDILNERPDSPDNTNVGIPKAGNRFGK